jgi:ABC-2 type transport system permease protein
MLRYWPNTVLTLMATVLLPLTYWAQAQGFAGGDDRALEAFASRAGTDNIAGFIYLGWAVFSWLSRMIWGPGMALRKERMQGSLEVIFLSPASRLAVLFGPAVAHLVPTTLIFSVVGLMLRFVFKVPIGPIELLAGLAIIIASIPILFGIGAIVGVLVLRFRDADGIGSAIRGGLGILCGVTYPIAVLPEWIQHISRGFPLTQVLDSLRTAVLQSAVVPTMGDRVVVLLISGVGLCAVAMILLDAVLRNAQRTGRLGHY